MNRKIVIHQCQPGLIKPGLFHKGDILFFDDCLYSQYVFFIENRELLDGIKCIFGFSSGLYRQEDQLPIEYIDSAIVHAVVNKYMKRYFDARPDEIRAFMTISELKKIQKCPNTEIALHGCVHLKLSDIQGRVNRLLAFCSDLRDGADLFKKRGFNSKIFVYPYAFCENGYEAALRRYGFSESFARLTSYRIPIESVLKGEKLWHE